MRVFQTVKVYGRKCLVLYGWELLKWRYCGLMVDVIWTQVVSSRSLSRLSQLSPEARDPDL